MPNNSDLASILNNNLEFRGLVILNIKKVNGFLFITLDNGQKILTNGKELYDFSKYDNLIDVLNIGNKICAVVRKYSTLCIVDLSTLETVFEDDQAEAICKLDDRIIKVIMKYGYGSTKLYDIKGQKYLPSPDNYVFEGPLGNNLYVFHEKSLDLSINFYDYKRCIINADGNIVSKNITGYISVFDNYVIIKRNTGLDVIRINEYQPLSTTTVEQTTEMILKPEYTNGKIIIIEKGIIKIYGLDLTLIRQIEIEGLNTILEHQIVSNTLKLLLPYAVDGKEISRHLFINLETGQSISHLRIEEYPDNAPEIYIGKDALNNDCRVFRYGITIAQTEYHIYDSNFDKITDINGHTCSYINENLLSIDNWNGQRFERQFINVRTRTVKNCDYDIIVFLPNKPYGYAFNALTDMMDIVDKNLSAIVSNIDYKQLGLSKHDNSMYLNFFVVNSYVCLIKEIDNGYHSAFRYIIRNDKGEIILDSKEHVCIPLGDLIQISKNGKSNYLNTLTGEISEICIALPTDEKGKIDFSKISNVRNVFQNNGAVLLLPPDDTYQYTKQA